MKTKFHWIVGNGLPEHSAIIEAVHRRRKCW